MALTEEQKAFFWENGYLPVPNLLTPQETAALAQRCDDLASRKLTHLPEPYVQLEPEMAKRGVKLGDDVLAVRKIWMLYKYDDFFRAHALNPRIVNIVADLLGTEDIKLYVDQLFLKAPGGVGSAKSWHQDSPYWSIEPTNLVSVWTALDDATEANGCMHYIAGSHKRGPIAHHQLDDFKILDEDLDLSKEVAVPIGAGGCIFHHSLAAHTTSANTSPYRRRAHVTAYMDARSKYTGDPEKRGDYIQVRGRSFEGCV